MRVSEALISTVLLLSCALAGNDEVLSPRIERLRAAPTPQAIAAFWEEIQKTGAPLIETIPGNDEEVLVTFLWRGKPSLNNVTVFASVLPENDATHQRLKHLAQSDLWYRTYRFPRNLLILYELAPQGPEQVQRDPLNARFIDGPIGGSIVALPGAGNLEWSTMVPTVRGTLESIQFRSKRLNNDRVIRVYLPSDFQRGQEYDVVMVLDEDVYNGPVPLPAILDNLISAHRIRPAVSILVGNTDRAAELSCNSAFSSFLASELLPTVEQRYGFQHRRERTTIAGSSLGGLAAACAGFQASSQFGNVIALSGSFRWRPKDDPEPEWFARQIAVSPVAPVHFFVGVGAYETGTPNEPANPSLLTASRHLRDVLRAKGYRFTYREFPGAHEPLSWRAAIAEAILDLQ